MKALILAGGRGTRLRPFTYRCPKPMLPVKGKPFLEYIIEFLRRQAIFDIVLCLHYKAESFVDFFGTGEKFGVRIAYSFEKSPLGTGGAIKNAQNHVEGTFFVLNGDTYSRVNLWSLLEYHVSKHALATIALAEAIKVDRYGLVELASDGCIRDFKEKAPKGTGYVNAGVYVFEPEVFDFIPEGVKVSLERDIFLKLLDSGRLCGYPLSPGFLDIGTPKDYRRSEKNLETFLAIDH